MRSSRFILFSACSMIIVLGLFFALLYGIPDRLNPTDPPLTTGENCLRCVCGVALWPFVVASLILDHDPPRIYLVPLWIVSFPCLEYFQVPQRWKSLVMDLSLLQAVWVFAEVKKALKQVVS